MLATRGSRESAGSVAKWLRPCGEFPRETSSQSSALTESYFQRPGSNWLCDPTYRKWQKIWVYSNSSYTKFSFYDLLRFFSRWIFGFQGWPISRAGRAHFLVCVSCFTSFIRRMGKYGGLNACVPPNLYGKALTLNVMALRDRAISR